MIRASRSPPSAQPRPELHTEIRWNFCLKPDVKPLNESAVPKIIFFHHVSQSRNGVSWGGSGGKKRRKKVILHNQ